MSEISGEAPDEKATRIDREKVGRKGDVAMSTSVLSQRIAEAAKILNPKSPSDAEAILTEALNACDCSPEDPTSTQLINYVEPDKIIPELIDGKSTARQRLAWDILVGNSAAAWQKSAQPQIEESEIVKLLKDQRPVGQWKDAELLEAYNQDCDPEVECVLKKKAAGSPVVIFKNEDEGVIDVESTLKCLRMSRRRDRMPETMRFDGKLKRLYRVGEFPAMVLYQCPLHSDVILYDGYCDKDDVNWGNVEYEAMQFVRLVKEAKEQPKRHREIEKLVGIAEEGIDALKEEFPKVGLKFDELRREDNLPNLKQRHSTSRGSADPVRASGGNRSY